jgi:dTDP-4-amino-4,6-dideoxygalactose transaminase
MFALSGKPFENQYGDLAMSNLSFQLARRMNYDYLYKERRTNFKFICQRIGALERIKVIHEQLPDGICPWGFPILVNNRDRIQKSLARRGITLPIHWRLPHHISLDEFPDSRYLSEHILTLPVFQGLERRKLSSLLCELEAINAPN